MKRSEYEAYQKAVADFLKGEEISRISVLIRQSGSPHKFFSHQSCDCCKRPLGGDRVEAVGITARGEVLEFDHQAIKFEICTDCEYYSEYGKLDDTTMMDMEEDLDERSTTEA